MNRRVFRRTAWSFDRVLLFPSDVRLFRITTPWGYAEFQFVPYGRVTVLTPDEEMAKHIGGWSVLEDDLQTHIHRRAR